MMSLPAISWIDLRAIAAQAGLVVMGVSDAEPLTAELERLAAWQAAGHGGDMRYMYRDAELLISPRSVAPQARSCVSFAIPYSAATPPAPKLGEGRVARYAWGRDYHLALQDRLEHFIATASKFLGIEPIVERRSDSVALLERPLAERAGIGFRGKNTLLIIPRVGSLFFLAEVLWNVEVTGVPAPQPSKGSCGGCTQCQSGCPTGAFVGPRVLDARKCISYLTIEKRGILSVPERRMIGSWVFGCDVCQEVCPFNHKSQRGNDAAVDADFRATAGVGPNLDLAIVLELDTERQFLARFKDTPLLRPRRAGLVRNAAIVAANTGAEALLPALEKRFENDASPTVRAHALWACAILLGQQGRAIGTMLDAGMRDPAAEVRHEATAILASHAEIAVEARRQAPSTLVCLSNTRTERRT